MTDLIIEPLEAAAFAPYGSLIGFNPAVSRRVNEGTARRADTHALLDAAGNTTPVLAFYRLDPQTGPLRLSLFERHPWSAQSFVSLSVASFLVVVAPSGPDGLPLPGAARAFAGCGGSGLSYKRDQWHTPVMALGAGGDLLMLMGQRGTADDCIEHRLTHPLTFRSPEGTTHVA